MSERLLHEQVVQYLKMQYPAVIFRTDFAAGMKLPIWLAVRQKKMQSGRGYPDLFVAEPRTIDNMTYYGLFLELKKEGEVIYRQDGAIRASKDNHLAEQQAMIIRLTELGYSAHFAIGFDQAQTLLDWYLSDKGDTTHGQPQRTPQTQSLHRQATVPNARTSPGRSTREQQEF